MNRKELEELLKHLNEDRIDQMRTPHGSVRNIRKWLDGYAACADKVYELFQKKIQEEERTEKFEAIINSVDNGKKKPEEDTWTEKEMSGKEDKANICRMLGQLLAHTTAGENIESIRYDTNPISDEFATISWIQGGKKTVNITADSGIAIIKDIIRAIE